MKTGSLGRLTSSCFLTLFLAIAPSRICTAGSSTITNLPTLGGSAFQGYGLNSAGQVTGFSYMPGDTSAHAFLYSQGITTDLGTLGGVVSQGFALNSAGQVVGEANLAGDTVTHAFLYDGTNLLDLGTLGGSYSSAAAINDAGQVVGSAYVAGDASLSAFLWANGAMVDLGSLGGGSSSAVAINQSGAIAGDSYTASFDQHAFLYQNGSMTDLGTLGGPGSSAYDLNDSGVVVGDSYLPTWDTHGFVYSGGVMTDVGTLGGSSSTANAINKAGQVIGVSTLASGDSHGFVYSNGSMTDLGTLGGNYSYARAINNSGEVVGDSAGADTNSYAFLWRNGQMVDLNSLLETNSGWVLQVAEFINDSHRVVGLGTYNGASAWFVMDLSLPSANQPPVAIATGPSGPVDCAAQVTLDGSASSDPDGDALTYQWSLFGTVLGNAVTLTASFPTGTNLVTLQVTDSAGASSWTNVTVVVTDTTPPTGSCPADVTAPADGNCQAAVPNIVAQVRATDNCTPANQLVITQNPVAGTVVGLGPHPVSVVVTDASGNSSSCSVLFTVVDATPPTIVSVAPATVPANSHCLGLVPDVLTNVVAVDNCSPVNLLVLSQSPAAGTVIGAGPSTVAVSITDPAGNTAVASVPLLVADSKAPNFVSFPGSVTVTADASGTAPVPDFTSSVAGHDNCTPADQLVVTQNPVAGTLLGPGKHAIQINLTDLSGNTKSRNVTFTVVDVTPPTVQSVTASPNLLAPANNAMVPVTIAVRATDAGDRAPVSRIISVSANEPVRAGQIRKTGPLSLNLAASNNRDGSGRVYAVTVETSDAWGNSVRNTVRVTVAH